MPGCGVPELGGFARRRCECLGCCESSVNGLSEARIFRRLPAFAAQGNGSVISGLEEVLVGMQPGGKRRALIPPEAGYLNDKLEPQVTLAPQCVYSAGVRASC